MGAGGDEKCMASGREYSSGRASRKEAQESKRRRWHAGNGKRKERKGKVGELEPGSRSLSLMKLHSKSSFRAHKRHDRP